jgi:pimeloyl-ACP methyl ester carboxylesterase
VGTFVLVHGGCHGGWCYQPVAALLRAAGHQVYAPTLTGLGERSHVMGPQVDLTCHVRDDVGLLRFEDLSDVILVGHGYGGMVITGAADRAPERVGHLLYLDAPVPQNGQSLLDVANGALAGMRRYVMRVAGVELCHPPAADLLPVCGVSDPALAQWMAPRLTPHPWRCFEQALDLSNEAALAAIPQSHVVSNLGSSCRDIDQLRVTGDGRCWELATGHDMMLTKPDWIADKLAASLEWL